MKRIYQLFFIAAATFSLMQLQSCKKHVNHKDIEDLKLCSIQKVIILRTGYNDTATFTYNALGNPTKIDVTNVATGNPNYVFKYDMLNRLSQFIGVYSNGLTENWVKYTYGPGGPHARVIVDTTFTFGAYNGGTFPTGYWGKRINRYTYDALGRISRIDTETILPSPSASSTVYNYDAAGNLIKPATVYDDRVNFHRTNSIWQLIDKDYSRNNPLTAVSYNPLLPLSFRSPFTYTHNFLSFPINQSDFIYNCDLSGLKLPKGDLPF
jgi:hypothetical protein